MEKYTIVLYNGAHEIRAITLQGDVDTALNRLENVRKATKLDFVYDLPKRIFEIDIKDLNRVALAIRYIRKELKLSQGELATLANLSLSYISQIERGFLVSSPKTYITIFAALLSYENNVNEISTNLSKKNVSISFKDGSVEDIECNNIRFENNNIFLFEDNGTIYQYDVNTIDTFEVK